MKKSIFVILALLMAVGFAFGGGNRSQSTSTWAEVEFPGGWKPTTSYNNHLTITLANVGTIEGYDYAGGDDYARWWGNAFNTRIEVTSMTYDNWGELMRIWVSSGDMPDVAIFNYIPQTHADAATWVEQGLIKKLPDNWKTRWSNLAAVFGKTSLGPQMEQTFGGTYFLPRTRFDVNIPHIPLPDHCSFVFRKDWAQAVGFPVKDVYKTSEIIEYGKLIKERDPGNIGARLLPISSNPNWSMRLFMLSNFQHFTTFYKDRNGVYQWGPAAEETLAGLKLFYQAYASGALNPEFYTVRDQEDYDQFRVSGISGGFFGEATTYHIWAARRSFGENIGPNADERVGVATVVGEDGYYHLEDLINYWGAHMFNPDISNEKLERWLDWLDFSGFDAGFRQQNFGFEGVDWRYGNNREVISLLPDGVLLTGSTGKYPSLMAISGSKQGDDLSFENPNTPKIHRDDSFRLYADRSRLSTPQTLTETDWALYTYDSPAMRRAATIEFRMEYANLVTRATSEAHLETLWRQWVSSQMSLIQPALNELRANLR